jgi:bifunctional non-homologous end joining protein LigD
MALAEYKRKRDFKKTPEPAGRVRARRRGALQFVIQKHAARRLHYDFRLELDGVMKSWAVPKGPSLDPKEKRLAVHVEDHPLEYNSFEGVIPQGEYGGGTVLLWDRGTWKPADGDDPAEAYAKGSLKFELDGEKLHGRWALVRMGGRANRGGGKENWLLIKERDDTAENGSGSDVVDENPRSVETGRTIEEIAEKRDRVWRSDRGGGEPSSAATPGAKKGRLPKSFAPQLATLATNAPESGDWVHEIKFDGYRILARIEDGRVTLFSRRGLDWTERFPRLAKTLGKLPVRAALIDGEAVALDEGGYSSFALLQEALSAGKTDELVYYAFDLVHLDGWNLEEAKLVDRKALLKPLIPEGDGLVRYSDHQEGSGKAFFDVACETKLEGMISKQRDAPYRSERSRAWLKIKCVNREDFAVIGWTDPTGTRVGIGALVLGYYDEKGKLHYAGRVGTGFDARLLAELRRALERAGQVRNPFGKLPDGAARGVHWVAPAFVVEVQFAGWTRDNVLRHAAFLGIREDKVPEEAVIARPVAAPSATKGKPAESAAKKGTAMRRAEVKLSNEDKVLYPGSGFTKGDIARYYETVAARALPHLAHRPLTLVRCPEGEGKACFFQKHIGSGVPSAIGTVDVPEKDGSTGAYLVIEDVAGLIGLVQLGVLEIHPWGATADDIEHPDRLIFDLDPDVGLSWDRITEAALSLRKLLGELGLETFAKTTGGKGLHVVLPVKPELGWDDAKSFTKAIADAFAEAEPQRYTAVMSKRARKGRLFIDYLRNGRGNTAVGAFSTRARPGATVSVPLSWDEVEAGVRSDAFTIETLPERLRKLKKDPWPGWDEACKQSLAAAVKRFNPSTSLPPAEGRATRTKRGKASKAGRRR